MGRSGNFQGSLGNFWATYGFLESIARFGPEITFFRSKSGQTAGVRVVLPVALQNHGLKLT